jgi:hypothetical protein
VAAPLLTPALLQTPAYFWSVLHNYTATRGYGLWAPLDPTSGFDILLIVAGLVLAAAALRARPAGWELAAGGMLFASTIHTSRAGIWLLLLLVAPAARALPLRRAPGSRAAVAAASAVVVVSVFGVVAPHAGRGEDVVRQAVQIAQGRPILADGQLGELVAVDGGRVWVGNPIDAFALRDQATYISWLRGEPAGDAALSHAHLVIVQDRSAAQRRLITTRRATLVLAAGGVQLYEVVSTTATNSSR